MLERQYTVVNLYLGKSDDDMTASHQVINMQHIPKVGEFFEFWSTRDEYGNYVGDGRVHEFEWLRSQEKFKGTVTRIEHLLEEKGECSKSWKQIHYINVYME